MTTKNWTWLALILLVFVTPLAFCYQAPMSLTIIAFLVGLIILIYQMSTGKLKIFG